MNREQLEELLTATIFPFNQFDRFYFYDLNRRLGAPFNGREINQENAIELVLLAYDAGLFAGEDGDALPSNDSHA